MNTAIELKQKLDSVWPLLDERTRRLLAANEAASLGFGGISVVHRACGLSRRSIAQGIREIQDGVAPAKGNIRRSGGGRKSITVSDPHLLEALEKKYDAQFKVVFDAIRQLMAPPEPKKRKIGFLVEERAARYGKR